MSVPRLRAPSEHGQVLAVPPFDQLDALLARNRTIFNEQASDTGRFFFDLRKRARREVLALSTQYHDQAGEPSPPSPLLEGEGRSTWFVAGHQPELFHPGVWFKNFALDQLAKKHGAMALNLIIDTDAAKPALLHAPAGTHVARLPFDRSTRETPYEERIVEDEATFASLPERVAPYAATWGFEPMLPSFWRDVTAQAQRTPLLGERFAAARRAIERRWGVVPREVPMSRVCTTAAFGWFVASILKDLPRFHRIYNDTVQAYRQANRIRSLSHPVPDLAAAGDWLEAPFWAWRSPLTPDPSPPRGEGRKVRRGKLFVRQIAGRLTLRVGDEEWPPLFTGDEDSWRAAQAQGFKIRPRALTTTMFARLLLADVFLHGIGGGIYDALTDRIIERYYGVSAPGYLIVSTTLLLPLERFPEAGRRLQELARLRRDLIFKPDRFVASNHAAQWLSAKQEWLAKDGPSHAERVERFHRLREINAHLRGHLADRLQHTQQEIAECATRAARHVIAARRDYSFCLFPEELLRDFLGSDFLALPALPN